MRLFKRRKQEQPQEPEIVVSGVPTVELVKDWESNPFHVDNKWEEARRNAALRLIDENTHGYIILSLKNSDLEGVPARVEVDACLPSESHPAFRDTCHHLASQLDG